MSYEYRNKRIIENFARRYTTNVSDEVDILFELEHVYSQAAKADEYEAKAKAFDDIRYAMEMQTAIGVSDEDTLIDIEHVILRLIERKESGVSDA